jgi:hypothetical protein
MTQMTLFAFPDEPGLFNPSTLPRTDKWDEWCLAILRGPSSFWDEDEQDYDPLPSGSTVPRQETFMGWI